jgi:hypothetical protein
MEAAPLLLVEVLMETVPVVVSHSIPEVADCSSPPLDHNLATLTYLKSLDEAVRPKSQGARSCIEGSP